MTTKKQEKIKFSKAFWVANTVELFERAAYMKKVAMPTCVVAFSSLVSGFIACVGQTSEQTVHS